MRVCATTRVSGRRATVAAEHGWFRAHMLYLDGAPIAFCGGEGFRRALPLRHPGYDPEYADYRVGNYVLMKLIEDLCEDPELTLLDFGFGDAEYKRRFGDRSWSEEDVLDLRAPSAAGVHQRRPHVVPRPQLRRARARRSEPACSRASRTGGARGCAPPAAVTLAGRVGELEPDPRHRRAAVGHDLGRAACSRSRPGVGYIHEPFNPTTDAGISGRPFARFFQYVTRESEARYAPHLERSLALLVRPAPPASDVRSARAVGRTARDLVDVHSAAPRERRARS